MQLFDPADFVHTWRPRDAGRGAGKPPPPLGPTPQGNASTLPPRIAFTGNLNQHSGLGGKEDFTHTGLTAIKREGPRSTMPSRTAPFISRLRLLRTAAALSPFSSSAPPRHSPRILRASPVGAPHPPRVSAAVSPLVLPVAAGFALFSMATAASSAASVHDFTVKVCTASCPPQNLDTPFPSGDLVPFQQRETEALYPYPIPLWGKVFAHRCLRDAATIRPFWDFLSQYLFGFSCRFFYPNLWRFSTCCYTA